MPFDQQPERSSLDVAADRLEQNAEERAFFLLWLVACIICNFLLSLFFTNSGPNSELLIGAGLGYLLAQGAVHAIWSVMGPWTFWVRLLLSFSTALILFGAFWGVFAIDAVGHSDFREVTWSILCCMPLYLFAIQSPLWAVRAWRNPRFVHRRSAGHPAETRPLSLRDLMLATVAVAVAFAATRLGKPANVNPAAAFLVPAMLGACGVAAVSLFSTVPTVYAVNHTRNPALAVIVTLGVEAFVYLVVIAVFSSIANDTPNPSVYPLLVAIFVSFIVFLTGPMLAVRLSGYQLLWGRAVRSGRIGDIPAVRSDGGKNAEDDGQDKRPGIDKPSNY